MFVSLLCCAFWWVHIAFVVPSSYYYCYYDYHDYNNYTTTTPRLLACVVDMYKVGDGGVVGVCCVVSEKREREREWAQEQISYF